MRNQKKPADALANIKIDEKFWTMVRETRDEMKKEGAKLPEKFDAL